MKMFIHSALTPGDLDVVELELLEWSPTNCIERGSPEYEIGAAAILTLFREGKRTSAAIRSGIERHKWLRHPG